jgi:hypothetical protein
MQKGHSMNKTLASMFLCLAWATAVPAAAQAPSAGDATPATGYRPGFGDLITATIQPRHIKLGLAGRAQNWSYAAYELHELEEAFDRATSVWPHWQSMPVGDMIRSVTRAPIDALQQAIKAGNSEAFTTAYQKLTEACDACHEAADRKIIVIRVPNQDAYPDQDFQPAKR